MHLLEQATKNSTVHAVVHTALLVVIAGLFLLARGEDRLYRTAANSATADTMSQSERVVALLHAAHHLVSSQNEYMGHINDRGFRSRYLASGDFLLARGGACGTYSRVLGRLLDQAGMRYRIVQMLCSEESIEGACHVFVEAEVDAEYVVLDPLYNHYFIDPNGDMATVEQVRENWSRYRNQVPSEYNMKYEYDRVRRTNWNKIPILTTAFRGLISMFTSVEHFSLRAHVLNIYRSYMYVLIFTEVSFIVATFRVFYLRRS